MKDAASDEKRPVLLLRQLCDGGIGMEMSASARNNNNPKKTAPV
jgi:hypothetical protein